jgi:hypothetical protein
MPISTSSSGDGRDGRYNKYQQNERYDVETLDFPGVTTDQAKTYLKRLGGGADDTGRLLEGIGWEAHITPIDGGVSITFEAHEEILDDLIRRFEEWTMKG